MLSFYSSNELVKIVCYHGIKLKSRPLKGTLKKKKNESSKISNIRNLILGICRWVLGLCVCECACVCVCV